MAAVRPQSESQSEVIPRLICWNAWRSWVCALLRQRTRKVLESAGSLCAIVVLSATFLTPSPAIAQHKLPIGMAETQAVLPPNPNGYYNIDTHLAVFVHEGAQTAGYFWSQQFLFTNGDGGYMGLQTNGRDNDGNRLQRSAVFSMFDNKAAVARGVTPGDTSRCKGFKTAGGDGTFVSCIVPFNWIEGKEYRLRIWWLGEPSPTTRRWGGWVQDVTSGAETFIGSIDVPIQWNWLGTYANAFTEYFGPGDQIADCAVIPYTFARWRNITANNADRVKPRARFGTHPNYPAGYGACLDFARGASVDGAIFHETGFGNTVRDGVELTIAHFYRSGLGRLADAGGFDYWRSITRNTGRGEQCATALRFVAQGIMTSPEFTARWADNASRVDRLYLTLLQRRPEDAGRNYWIQRANTLGNWSARVTEFLAAPETIGRQAAICRNR